MASDHFRRMRAAAIHWARPAAEPFFLANAKAGGVSANTDAARAGGRGTGARAAAVRSTARCSSL